MKIHEFKKACFDRSIHIMTCKKQDQSYIIRYQTFKIVRKHKPTLKFTEPKTKTFYGELSEIYIDCFSEK